jgi:hypothetical protein
VLGFYILGWAKSRDYQLVIRKSSEDGWKPVRFQVNLSAYDAYGCESGAWQEVLGGGLTSQALLFASPKHHLRNALDVILASDYLRQTDRATAIWESVERID